MHDRQAVRMYDMGCGLGRHTVLMAKQGFSVVASDISSRARGATRQKLHRANLQAEVIDADMTRIPYPDDHFDGVLSIGVMEHNTKVNIEKAVSEIQRTLSPGGQILASFLPRTRHIPADDRKHDMVEDNTLRSYGPEQTIHHMVDEDELRELFCSLDVHSIEKVTEVFDGGSSTEFYIIAEEPHEA